ncbi:hypothetical protein [Synechocystis sp. LKSZ1]|uniref:hypothetical protein n=1 Tax=Synechocystis sp. LKSZ1 TaxID=3144951 RepID=UPI00336BEA0A
MSQKDNFASGFFWGSLVGGVVGGVLGTVLANRALKKANEPELESSLETDLNSLETEADIELARRRLEDKIAQLNGAIDEVRYQLGNVESLGMETREGKN